MTENEMLEKTADMLDCDANAIDRETRLDDCNWDSMAMLSVIALGRANGKHISGEQVRNFKTVGDILKAAFQ